MHWFTLACRLKTFTDRELQHTLEVMQNGVYGFTNYNNLRSVIEFIHNGSCREINPGFAYAFLDSLEKNPTARKKPGARHQLHQIRGILFIRDQKYNLAKMEFEKSLQAGPRIETALVQIALLGTAEQYEIALEHLRFVQSTIKLNRKGKPGQLDYAEEIQYLENQLKEDLKEQSGNNG